MRRRPAGRGGRRALSPSPRATRLTRQRPTKHPLPRTRHLLPSSPFPTSTNAKRPLAVAITGGIGAGKSAALEAFARHGAATRSSDEIVHRLLRSDPEVRRAAGRAVRPGGDRQRRRRPRGRCAASSSTIPTQLDWLEELLHPRVVQEHSAWRERAGRGSRPSRRDRDRGAAPVRDRRRQALRRRRGDHGAGGGARGAQAGGRRPGERACCRRTRRSGSRTTRMSTTGRSRAGCVRRRRDDSLVTHEAGPRPRPARRGVARDVRTLQSSKPGWWERLWYPLSYQQIVRGHARNYDLDPALLAAVIYQESKFKADAQSTSGAIGLMQLLPDTAKGIALHTGGIAVPRRGSLRPGDQRPLRRLVPPPPAAEVRRRAATRSLPTTPVRTTSTAGVAPAAGSSSPRRVRTSIASRS